MLPKDEIDPTKDGTQDNNGVVDAFGSDNKDPIPPKEGEDEGEGKKKEEDKKHVAIPDDHPTIVALKQQIDDVKKEYGTNLSGQRDVIKRLEGEIETFKKGGKPAEGDTSHLPFDPKSIVYSKDLPKEKLDDMTDNEIKLHDELMKTHEIMNKTAQERFEEKQKAEGDKKAGETQRVEDLNQTVRAHAKELAKGDEKLANEIIESVKQFNLTGLNEAEVKARVENAHKLLPTYTPPKEQTSHKGGKPVTGTEDKSDPFGTSKIVEEVASKRNGQTFAL